MTEIIGTLSMKYASVNGGMIGHIVMYVMITASYVLLSVAVKRVALGVAYALWEGIGILFITLFSVLWFDEPISALKVLGGDADRRHHAGEIRHPQRAKTGQPAR